MVLHLLFIICIFLFIELFGLMSFVWFRCELNPNWRNNKGDNNNRPDADLSPLDLLFVLFKLAIFQNIVWNNLVFLLNINIFVRPSFAIFLVAWFIRYLMT
jgi:hypothetical protein